jgi:hypothetical protein
MVCRECITQRSLRDAVSLSLDRSPIYVMWVALLEGPALSYNVRLRRGSRVFKRRVPFRP